MFTDFIRQSLLMVVVISGIPLLITSCVGLVISFLQCVTQIQEQTVIYFAKVAAMVAVGIVLSEWYTAELLEYFQDILQSLVIIGHMR